MRWKLILGILGGLILVLIVVVYVILATYNFNRLKPQITRTVQEATGRKLTLGGDIRLKIGLTPALVVENVSFQNAPWGSQPEMAKIKRFEVRVALFPLLFGSIHIKRFVLIDPDILIETSKSGESNLKFTSGKKEGSTEVTKEKIRSKGEVTLPAVTVNELRIVKGNLLYRDDRSGKTFAVTLENLTASAKSAESPVKTNLKGTYNGQPFEMDGTLGPLAALGNPNKPWPLDLTFKILDTTLTLDGSIKNVLDQQGMALRVRCRGKDLSTLGKLTGGTPPLRGPFDVSCRITDPAPKMYRISDLKAVTPVGGLNGWVKIDLAGNRPDFTATLSAGKVDLRPILAGEAPKGKGGGKSVKAAKGERLFSSTPLPLDGLKRVDATVQLTAGGVLLPKLALNNLVVGLRLRDGDLKVKPFKGVIGGGAMSGHVDLTAQGKTAVFQAAVKIDRMDVGRMLKELDVSDAVEGNLDADVNLKGRGTSLAELMGGLNGKTVVVMGQGKINKNYLDLLGGNLGSNILRLINPFQREAQYTAINCFVSGFSIRDGLAETTALLLNTDKMLVVGQGNINLKTEKLNFSLKPVPKQGIATGIAGKVSMSLGELARPFRLSGTLAHPSLGIDKTQAALTIGKMIGGIALFGPAGIASGLVGSSSGEKDPCLAAIEAAKKGIPMARENEAKQKGPVQETTKGLQQGIQNVGKELRKLFNR